MFTNIMDTSSVRNIKFRAIEPPPNHHFYCQHFCLVVQNVSGWCISPSLHYSQLPTEVIVPSPWPSLGVCLMRSAALIVTHSRIICINGSIYMKRRVHWKLLAHCCLSIVGWLVVLKLSCVYYVAKPITMLWLIGGCWLWWLYYGIMSIALWMQSAPLHRRGLWIVDGEMSGSCYLGAAAPGVSGLRCRMQQRCGAEMLRCNPMIDATQSATRPPHIFINKCNKYWNFSDPPCCVLLI